MRDLAGYEQTTHSATNLLHFSKALGSDMDWRDMYRLMREKQVGEEGSVNLGVRYRKLAKILNNHESWEHSLQELASVRLEDLGLKYTKDSVSDSQETRLRDVIGNDVGKYILTLAERVEHDMAVYPASQIFQAYPFLRSNLAVVENIIAFVACRHQLPRLAEILTKLSLNVDTESLTTMRRALTT